MPSSSEGALQARPRMGGLHASRRVARNALAWPIAARPNVRDAAHDHRREVLQVGAATAAIARSGWSLGRALAQQRLTEDELLEFDGFGNVTLLHVTDMHAQLVPVYFREPSINLGVGEAQGLPPHLTGADFLDDASASRRRSAAAYALTAEDFAALAQDLRPHRRPRPRWRPSVKAVRAERGEDRVLLLDGGDTWQGSLGANRTKGQDMVDCVKLLKPDAMTGHWEFTYGEERVKELVESARLSVPRAQHPRHRMAGAGVRRLQDVREGRRQDRGARPGLSLHADRQSALDDAELVVRHPRGRRARATSRRRARRARSSSCCCRTTASTSTASSPRASPAST